MTAKVLSVPQKTVQSDSIMRMNETKKKNWKTQRSKTSKLIYVWIVPY
jgi:hypothetical protein